MAYPGSLFGRNYDHQFRDLNARLDQVLAGLERISSRMPTIDDLRNLQGGLDKAITDAAARVTGRIDALNATVADLQSKLAAGSAITQADLDRVQSEIDQTAQIAADSLPMPTPTPGPAPTPTPTPTRRP